MGPFTHTFLVFLFIVKIYLSLQLSTFNSVVILMPNDGTFSPDLHFHQFHHCQTARLLVIFCDPCSFWKTLVPRICASFWQGIFPIWFTYQHEGFSGSFLQFHKKFDVYFLLSSFKRHHCRKLKKETFIQKFLLLDIM